MNLIKVAQNVLIGSLEFTPISGISRDVMWPRSQSRQSFLLGKNGSVDLATSNPDDLGLISTDQVFTPDLANTTCSSDDYIDAASAVRFTHIKRGDIQRAQDLAIP